MKLHPQFLKKNGCNVFVVLLYEEFERLQERLEDAEDVLELRRARKENAGRPSLSLQEAKERLGLSRLNARSKPRRKTARRR